MLFWIFVAVLTAAVCAVLLYPLLRGAKAGRDRRAGEEAVYRDQLSELDRDRAEGLITDAEADYARAEIGRRLLAVAAAPADAPRSAGGYGLTQAFIVVALPVVGLCLYLLVGHPGMPSQPLAARLANPGNDMAVLIVKAEQHLAQHPEDGKGWDVLAPIYFKSMRVGDAELAYRHAIALLGPSPERLDSLAEVLMATSENVVTDEAQDLLRQSLTLQPDNPRAEFYLALALEQAGKTGEAKAAFEALAKASPADAPWLPIVQEHIARNGGAPEAPADTAAAKAPGNPTAADVASAETMNAGDRMQMIRGMVATLDARLKDDPDNFEGWMRLIRSYAVLKDDARAADALKRALTAFPPAGAEGRQLVALARELGLATEDAQQ